MASCPGTAARIGTRLLAVHKGCDVYNWKTVEVLFPVYACRLQLSARSSHQPQPHHAVNMGLTWFRNRRISLCTCPGRLQMASNYRMQSLVSSGEVRSLKGNSLVPSHDPITLPVTQRFGILKASRREHPAYSTTLSWACSLLQPVKSLESALVLGQR